MNWINEHFRLCAIIAAGIAIAIYAVWLAIKSPNDTDSEDYED